ncbi:hypothetical protein AKAW_05448 [Aspergillus niger]|uniref:Uncharacterized protein n=1 Tax=Aspergillus niger TaxID=5061 RepID=A0A100I900_ASPNG|nr:hypothetical protein AKAW_05448 [Aspergillus niger]
MKLSAIFLQASALLIATTLASPLPVPEDGSIRIPVKGAPAERDDGSIRIPVKGAPAKRDDGVSRIPVKGAPEKETDGVIRIPVKGAPAKREDGSIRIPVKGAPNKPTQDFCQEELGTGVGGQAKRVGD